MRNTIDVLIHLCTEFLEGKLRAELFVEKFQEQFEARQERLKTPEFDALDEVYMACEYYQPDTEVRELNHKLIDEITLRQVASQAVERITAVSTK